MRSTPPTTPPYPTRRRRAVCWHPHRHGRLRRRRPQRHRLPRRGRPRHRRRRGHDRGRRRRCSRRRRLWPARSQPVWAPSARPRSTADGALQITAGSGYGLALGEGDSAIVASPTPPATPRDYGFAHYLRPQRSARRQPERMPTRLRGARRHLAADARLLSRSRLDVDAGPPPRLGSAAPATIAAPRRWRQRSSSRRRHRRPGRAAGRRLPARRLRRRDRGRACRCAPDRAAAPRPTIGRWPTI